MPTSVTRAGTRRAGRCPAGTGTGGAITPKGLAKREKMNTKPEKIRYNRIAPLYDWLEILPERLVFRAWRRRLFHFVQGPLILEVGIGTGKNLPYYPDRVTLVGVDISERMLIRATRKTITPNVLGFLTMDAQTLAFPDGTFDQTLSTFVFCSVYDPIQGLQELLRVLRPEGKALFLEHVRPESRFRGKWFDRLNPLVVSIMGAHINRPTVRNIRQAGFIVEQEINLWSDIVKLIVARKPK